MFPSYYTPIHLSQETIYGIVQNYFSIPLLSTHKGRPNIDILLYITWKNYFTPV